MAYPKSKKARAVIRKNLLERNFNNPLEAIQFVAKKYKVEF